MEKSSGRIGIMEWWSVGVLVLFNPSLHHSNLFLVSYVLREPFQRQGMAESSGFGEIVGCAANGGELKPLRALIVEKRDLLIVGAANPSARHYVGYATDVGIVDLVRGRQRYFLFLLLVA